MYYNENFFEVVQTEGLEEFAANSPSPNEESAGITEVHCLEGWTVVGKIHGRVCERLFFGSDPRKARRSRLE